MLILIILDNTGEKMVKKGVFCIEYVLALCLFQKNICFESKDQDKEHGIVERNFI